MNEKPKFMSISDAAKQLGYGSGSTLALLCRQDKVPGAFKLGNSWALPASWVDEQVVAAPPSKGGPRGRGVRKKT